MKTLAQIVGLTAAGILVLSGCSSASSEVEDKIKSLEKKITTLEGSAKSEVEVLIEDVPLVPPPIGVSAQGGNAEAKVMWNAPDTNGSSPITGYRVSSIPGGFTCSTEGAKTCTVTELVNDTSYSFVVTAATATGSSEPSAASNSVTPSAPSPDAPSSVSAKASNGSVTVSWNAPASNDGAPITGYKVSSQPGGFTCTTSGATSCTVRGLVNNTPHTFTVTAITASGMSEPSVPSNSVTPRAPIPDAPSGVIARAGTGQATVAWKQPQKSGSVKVSGYMVTSTPGGFTCSTRGKTQCTVTGLANGTEYTFSVTAQSSQAVSVPSVPSNAVTPQMSMTE